MKEKPPIHMITHLRRTHNVVIELADPVFIACLTPHGYYLHNINDEFYFVNGKIGAEIWPREAAEEFCYRNQLRNFFFEPVVAAD